MTDLIRIRLCGLEIIAWRADSENNDEHPCTCTRESFDIMVRFCEAPHSPTVTTVEDVLTEWHEIFNRKLNVWEINPSESRTRENTLLVFQTVPVFDNHVTSDGTVP